MTSVDLPTPDRVVAIGAHPDDIEFGCGATLAKWSAAGTHVEMVVLTDGSKGTWDPTVDPVELAATRVAEQIDAAEVLGAAATHRLRAVDGELTETPELRAAICRVLRTVRPDVVIGHDPWKRYRLHPDHRHAGFLTIDAIVAARDPHFFPDQGLEPHRPDRLLLFEAEEPDHLERVDTSIDAKIEALLRHTSQWRSTLGIDPDGDVEQGTAAFETSIRTTAAEHGAAAGVPFAEAFKLLGGL